MKLFACRCALVAFAVCSAVPVTADGGLGGELPWRQVGLTERQAAAHLLDRFAYGAGPGQIDELVDYLVTLE